MDNVDMARAFFGSSMAFHIIFATLGVGIPLMIVFGELMYQIKKDDHYKIMAKRWTRALGIILGVAIPSGTIVGVLLSLLWPGFMEIVGQVIAVPFQVEIWAFFLEAIFMSIYVFAADRLSNLMRIISVIFVAIGATASAVFITNVHSWMNTPRGFDLVNGEVVNVDPWAAVFNPSFAVTATHVVVSAYMTGAFIIASIAAFQLLKNKNNNEKEYHRKALFLSLMVGGLMSLTTAINGHETAQMLHEYQPEKLAAAEGLFETTAYAPLAIGGYVDKESEEVIGAVEIPWALSFLATNRFDGEVKGLNEFPKDTWPPLYIHILFNIMVGVGTFLIIISFVSLFYRFVLKKTYPRWLLWILTTTGLFAMIGIQSGWIFSCTGRQPWTIYYIQKTEDAATTSPGIGTLFVMFISLYVLLLLLTMIIMLFYFRRNPLSKELHGKGVNG
ncbi:cytochrome ubiquinol oxidase subunit I [Longirhabdus pacifica]|uniref:cytochrome ubiquinol oxidase subunit I n=1 Tax=Longirhabdus pacifica TaxID=2305227 RepID=UPI00100931A2|nr:cytochrome ubiquinol oxidase subunit I [Longirhabdus pacifica]